MDTTVQNTPVPTINSTNIAPQTTPAFQTPNPTPIPPVTTSDPYTLTAPEQGASDLSKTLENLNNQLIGKSAYTTEQNTAAGIPDLQARQNDLNAQLKQLKAESDQIPLQMQQDATGRGITAGGLQPVQTAALRNNSIKALGVSAMLDATNGLLASAQQKVATAVSAKFDPIQEQIDAATKNLKLVMSSPDYTQSEKQQAQAQLDLQKQKQATLDKAVQDTKDVNAIAIEAAKNGASATTLQSIMNAKDQASAIQAAGDSLQANKNSQSVQDVNGQKILFTYDNNGKVIGQTTLGASSSSGGKVAHLSNGSTMDAYDYATQLWNSNPNASPTDIKSELLKSTNLNSTEIDALIAAHTPTINTSPTLTSTDITSIGSALLGQMSSADALSAVQGGKLNINGKDITLSPDQIQQITDEINKTNAPASSSSPWWKRALNYVSGGLIPK